MIKLPKLILASNSPRRAEILTSVGWEFTKDAADIDEIKFEGESPENYVQRLAQEKALAVARKYENAIVLGADTTVVINQLVLGKPVDLDDARNMLKMLSGNWHEVLTGVALIKTSEFKVQSLKIGLQRTRVRFAEMSAEEIGFLVEKGNPLDKAGAYAVQAQAALFIEKIEGDYWNVVGLPVSLVYQLFANLNVSEVRN
jgi:septum formation protein